jgi:hypothetical protein
LCLRHKHKRHGKKATRVENSKNENFCEKSRKKLFIEKSRTKTGGQKDSIDVLTGCLITCLFELFLTKVTRCVLGERNAN